MAAQLAAKVYLLGPVDVPREGVGFVTHLSASGSLSRFSLHFVCKIGCFRSMKKGRQQLFFFPYVLILSGHSQSQELVE
jgi:hypothetical protein